MVERWKKIVENTNYEVSSLGRIRGPKGIRKLAEKRDGRLAVIVRVNGKAKELLIHRLVAEAFLEKPELEEALEVHHIDKNCKNNSVDNLMWVTKEQHKKFHPRIKKTYQLSEAQKKKKHDRYMLHRDEILKKAKEKYWANPEKYRKSGCEYYKKHHTNNINKKNKRKDER